MKVITAPESIKDVSGPSLMLLGGITGAAHWQPELMLLLTDIRATLLNPRRAIFDINDRSMEREQIEWEFMAMQCCTAASFWFTPETICPITLLELGKMIMDPRRIFLGVHPDYVRRRDVEIQSSLARPSIKIHYSIVTLAAAIREWDSSF